MAEFATLRKILLKDGAGVVEKAFRIRIHLASACPDAALFRLLPSASSPLVHDRRGAVPQKPEPVRFPNTDTANLKSRHRSGPNAKPCAHRANR